MVPTLRRTSNTQRLPSHVASHARGLSWGSIQSGLRRFWRAVSQVSIVSSLRLYFGHSAFLPSFALSLLYMTVLSFSGQMLTYLLAAKLTLWQVGIMRAGSSIFELSATWIAPRLTRRIGVVRTGLWSINWQMTWLAAGLSWFFYYYGRGYSSTDLAPAVGLAVATAFSRVGLWGFDLSAQSIVQEASLKSHRHPARYLFLVYGTDCWCRRSRTTAAASSPASKGHFRMCLTCCPGP